MNPIIILILIVIAIELFLKPRIDVTVNNKWILWYGGKNNRKHLFLN